MSADRQRLTSAIRRIAKTDPEIRGLLKAADNKGGKPGAAGVGSSTDAESQRICCDGSVSDNANPGTGERDPDADGAGQDGGLNGSDPAKLDMGEGTLSGVTDCATGEPICFSGGGHLPPDGWDEPNSAPPVPTVNINDPCSDIPTDPVSYTNKTFYAWDSRTGTLWARGCYGNNYSQICFGFPRCGDGVTYQQPRNLGTYEEAPANPDGDKWPTDGCVNLAIKNDTIVGSKYDPENDGTYSAPRDSIDLCDGSGNQISLAPAANGGWKTINSTTNNGYLYDSSGKQIAHIDGNEYSDPSV